MDGETEEAWVPAGSGEGAWHPVSGAAPLDAEERIPLFPVPTAGTPPRRVWAGLVPTASRETYTPGAPAEGEERKDTRLAELDSGPGEALKAVPVVKPEDDASGVRRKAANTAALQAVFELANFLDDNVRSVADRGANGLMNSVTSVGRAAGLVQALTAARLAGPIDFAWDRRAALLGAIGNWPAFDPATFGLKVPMSADEWRAVSEKLPAALPKAEAGAVSRRGAEPVPKFDLAFDPRRARRYVIRCVYTRDGCPPVASAASAPFAIAPVHDPDAPARTIRIPMPIDLGLGALRRMKKNVGFVLSKDLNARVQSLAGKKLKDIDEGNVSAGGSADEEVCSFALPIITLCAMIVLYIFLALLNIVFFWMPLVKICLPIPKGKSP
jgi:hypothetical protein